jgi:hypothetical protein
MYADGTVWLMIFSPFLFPSLDGKQRREIIVLFAALLWLIPNEGLKRFFRSRVGQKDEQSQEGKKKLR